MARTQFILEPEDRHHVGVFVHAALDQLWRQIVDDDGYPGGIHGCCTTCCGLCNTLFELLKTGQLDLWVRFWPEQLQGTAWWNAEKGIVDRGWLDRAWANEDRLGCHEQ